MVELWLGWGFDNLAGILTFRGRQDFLESLVKVSVSTTFNQSRSRQLENFPVSMSLGLDNLEICQSR